jgi:hypothetical protein
MQKLINNGTRIEHLRISTACLEPALVSFMQLAFHKRQTSWLADDWQGSYHQQTCNQSFQIHCASSHCPSSCRLGNTCIIRHTIRHKSVKKRPFTCIPSLLRLHPRVTSASAQLLYPGTPLEITLLLSAMCTTVVPCIRDGLQVCVE